MSAHVDARQHPAPVVAPSTCWECERLSADVFEARFPSPTEQRSSVVLCRRCFQACYMTLSVELLLYREAAPSPS